MTSSSFSSTLAKRHMIHRYLILSIFQIALLTLTSSAQANSRVAIDNNFNALVHSGGQLLGLDKENRVYAFPEEGSTFTLFSTISTDPLDEYLTMSCLEDTIIAVGSEGIIARSNSQGQAWISSVNQTFFSGNLQAVAAKPDETNHWLAVGNDGFDGIILSSTDDGQTWLGSTNIEDTDLHGVVWTGTSWLICGRDNNTFNGTIYRSTDSISWEEIIMPIVDTAPLLAVASDGTGNVVVVGEQGVILHSSNDGLNFMDIGQGLISEDLLTIITSGVDQFVIGGSGKSILEVRNGSAEITQPPASGAPDTVALLLNSDTIYAAGAFAPQTAPVRSIPFVLNIIKESNSYVLSVEETLIGKTYSLQYSVDLQNWTLVTGSSKNGLNGLMQWVEPLSESQVFWRVAEF